MNELTALTLDRAMLIEVSVPAVKELILSTHSKPEALVKLDYIARTLEAVDKLIRAELAYEMDGSYTLDAYNRFDIRRQKARAKWQYIDATHQRLVAKRNELDAEIKEIEKELIKQGRALDENENQYCIVLTERKLTVKPKGGNDNTKSHC